MGESFEVVVVGSLHLDIMVKGPHLPQIDETVMGSRWGYKCGGKGGNQAVAASRARARTAFVGCVGDDDFGRRLLTNLDDADVDRTRIVVDGAAGSGMSVAIETADGDYGAVVVPGANRKIAAAQLDGLTATVLLLQNEIEPAINLAAAERLKPVGAIVIHNMAPFVVVDQRLLKLTDVVVVNRVEAEAMTGERDYHRAALAIAAMGCTAIVTAGEQGSVVAARGGSLTSIAATPVKAVSTHGAGDCFCGTLAAELAKGINLAAATAKASAAAARLVSGQLAI